MYKAKIYYTTTEDNWNEGLLLEAPGTEWEEVVYADTRAKLKEKILSTLPVHDLERNDLNEYEHASEYWANYLVNNDNYEADKREIEAWKQGNERLWLCDAHILISKVTETKATL